jgi:hypothetical protein
MMKQLTGSSGYDQDWHWCHAALKWKAPSTIPSPVEDLGLLKDDPLVVQNPDDAIGVSKFPDQGVHAIWNTKDAWTDWDTRNDAAISFTKTCVSPAASNVIATLFIIVDDSAFITINGRYIGGVEQGVNFQQNGYDAKFDVTLKPGPNVITIDAKNNGGPAHLSASVITKEGTVLARTDSSWTWTWA